MVRRIRILVLLLVSGVSVAASGADNSVSANDESHSSLPDLASESAKKEEQENKGKTFKEQGADYFINSATQGFDNLTPEALESQARGYIQGQVTSSAQSYLEGMLSPYGKVRTSLSIGEGGDLDGSSLDYFIPWYDNQSTLFFSQISAQRKEDRTIGNVGLGVRQNVGNWLLGGNAFYDYDFTRGHRRLGLGTEAWTDYLKFSGNYYHPLSDWKDSKDFDFYEERPARGWDIRMESWLPFYPQLGAKLVYEQYYGDEVALFGTDNLQKDPHAVTVGLNYTPVPLVTVGTDYKAGTGDSNDFSVNATVNYQIGTPLAAQLDPENVKIQHSLMGSRTDFVDRNNFIVLEYREKDPLDVTLWLKADATNEHPECVIEDTPEAAVGLEKCKWTVNALINHHYKIISASWQAKNNAARTLVMPVVKADALTEGNNNRWNLVLPAWVNADTQANGPGVKTPLVAHPSGAPALKADVDVIFTTLTSPDSGSANMYGHMADNSTATVDGESYTFSRPKLAAETDGEDRAVSINNESWAQFNWANADKHCDILPDARQLEGLKIERGDLSTTLGWPVGLTSGDEEYWSSSQGSIATDHISIDMRSRSLTQMPDATQSLVSCVDKASPAVTPKLVISAD
ncbi:inverse autotransporter beta domain-containing protein [Salmonella enterica subsp. enterica serovar Miami]|nr:inverse autotransporter beta domain-containing protein [Salmonella enterica subsp. enterica serovar Miami]